MNKPTIIMPPTDPVDEQEKVPQALATNCTMCRHFHKLAMHPTNGQCRLNPPTVHLIGIEQGPLGQMLPRTWQAAPEVGPAYLCGQFTAKPEKVM